MLLKPVKTAFMLWLNGNDSILRAAIFLALAGMPYKYTQCHTTLGELSSVRAKLEPASSKNNEILEINILQKFTPHALFLGCKKCWLFDCLQNQSSSKILSLTGPTHSLGNSYMTGDKPGVTRIIGSRGTI